jgi:D-alanyl-D-alanine carboxypeptidase
MHRSETAPTGGAGHPFDRRTLLLGATGALTAAALPWPALAARPRFDPRLAHELQRAMRDFLRDPSIHAPGAILHVHSSTLGSWTGVAGLGRVAPAEPMRRADRFRAGSIAKPFVAVAVLQLVEDGRLSLDAPLPQVLPASVVGRFPNAADITVRMLLGHRSGIPEWDPPGLDEQIARDPARVWNVSEFLDRAAAQPPVFAPGTGFFYSNTDYNLLGLIIERLSGRSWRHEVARRVIRPLGLPDTYLPSPGHRSIGGAHAHGYREVDGKRVDLTRVDPSVAGAAGGGALVTTVGDLARFLDVLLNGRLFRHRETLRQMLAFAPAQDTGGVVGYGLGVEQRALPGGVELIGHLGTAAGYRAYVGRLRPQNATISFALNWEDDPTALVIAAAKARARSAPGG